MGVWGVSGPKSHWGMHVLDKIMILEGMTLTIQPLGVGSAHRPKKAQNGGGGYLAVSHLYGPAWLGSNNLCEVILTPTQPAHPHPTHHHPQ